MTKDLPCEIINYLTLVTGNKKAGYEKNRLPELKEMNHITRRRFLEISGTTVCGLVAGPIINELKALNAPYKQMHIVIAGAGLAGLCAAYELEKLGHAVTILEADKKHVGGRVRTLRFRDGLYGEAGAMRVPLAHKITRHYIKEFGLTLRKFVQDNPEGYYFIRGARVRIRDVKKLYPLFRLKQNETTKTPDELWSDSITSAMKNLNKKEKDDLLSDSPSTERIKSLDRMSFTQLCENAGLSEDAIELLLSTTGGEPLMFNAATEVLREELVQLWNRDFHEIAGGTDLLPAAFLKRLKSKPRPGCEIVRIEQEARGGRVAAAYRDTLGTGKIKRAQGDFLLCTIPFPALQRLEIDPPFSSGKQRAIRQLNYDSSTKVLFTAKKRFWETDEDIYGGGLMTDLATGMTYFPSDNAEARDPKISAGPAVFLASYSWGQAARRLASLPHPSRSELVLRQLSRVMPKLNDPGMLLHSASWSWDAHPWSGGAFAWFMPGQHTGLHKEVIAPEGRVFFAGEHASLTHTWMQGALESALRAVREILRARQNK